MNHTVTYGKGGWWTRLQCEIPHLGRGFMDRGPYRFRWMALCALPFARTFGRAFRQPQSPEWLQGSEMQTETPAKKAATGGGTFRENENG